MQTVDEKPETIHLYVVRENEAKPQIFPIFLFGLILTLLSLFCVFSPYRQPEVRTTLRVPAAPASLKTFSATVQIIPTGIHVYPATTAHGVLTITNGSIIAQVIPAGFQVGNVVTDTSVYVPAGSVNGFGYATVTAHALYAGKSGNIPAYTINHVEDSSIYIRNLQPFTGGRDAYAVKFITMKDRQIALVKAQAILMQKSIGLHYPCKENLFRGTTKMVVAWNCQFVTYSIPSYMHVTSIKLIGKNLFISVWFVERPPRFSGK